MILNRIGNKRLIASDIYNHFPQHNVYIEPFFGAGGLFFSKPKVKLNILNDIDSDVFNLFNVIINDKEKLKELYYLMPIHIDLFNYWKNNKEIEPLKKAIRFILLSNYSFYGTGYSLRFQLKDINTFNALVDETYKRIFDVNFLNCDFRVFFNKIVKRDIQDCFIYCDPPYLNTDDNYSNSFKEQDLKDLINVLIDTKQKFAISEFKTQQILNIAKDFDLNIIDIKERQTVKNINTEILITNYKNNQLKIFV